MTRSLDYSTPDRESGRATQNLWMLVMVMAGFRFIYAGVRELVPDEAFYWVLSRRPAGGYLDHPPMVAWLIRASTRLIGNTELGVRFFAVALAFAALIILIRLGRVLIPDPRTTPWLLAIWLTSPLFAGLATIITPDTPALFFSVCALVCAVMLARNLEPGASQTKSILSIRLGWFGFGLFTGLAMLSKYTTVLLPASVVAAMLTSPTGRRQFLRPEIYVAGLVALLVFSPVIHWNATHQWASFSFQLHHGLSGSMAASQQLSEKLLHSVSGFGEYLGGQLLLWTPILFGLSMVVLVHFIRRYRSLALAQRVLVWTAATPLLFFAYASTRSHGEANWPAFAYFPLSLLIIMYLQADWTAARVNWARIGCLVALLIAIPLHAPEMFQKIGLVKELPRKMCDMYGWRRFGQELDRVTRNCVIVAATHQDAAVASFYMKGQPDVWALSSRPTSFDFFDDRPDFSKLRQVFLLQINASVFAERFGFDPTPVETGQFLHKIWGHDRTRKWCIVVKPTK